MIWTEDLSATIDFYCNILGFECGERNDDSDWASLRIDDVAIMAAKPSEHTQYEKIGFTGNFYFNTDNVDALWENLKDKARVCFGIESFEYGMREFAIYDNNGYVLRFGQDIKEL